MVDDSNQEQIKNKKSKNKETNKYLSFLEIPNKVQKPTIRH